MTDLTYDLGFVMDYNNWARREHRNVIGVPPCFFSSSSLSISAWRLRRRDPRKGFGGGVGDEEAASSSRMASIRRLLPSFSSSTSSRTHILGRPFLCSSSSHGGAGGGQELGRSFTSGVASAERMDGGHPPGPAGSDDGAQIEKIRRLFEDAKRSFLSNPAALKNIPPMNPQGIYVNKNLKLDDIHVYGFDYDYTLAHYSENLQTLTYDLAKEHLVKELRYPKSCLDFKYDPTFPIRGLYYDRLKGCLLKLDFFGSIEQDGCYYGRRKLTMDEIKAIYGTRHIGRDLASVLVGLMDFFCFSEACLIADIVQHFVDAKLEFDPLYIYQDVKHAIQHVHISGLLHRSILSDPERYLVKNGKMLQFLEMLKEKEKKLFLLTNSPFYFVDGGMRFMLERMKMQPSMRSTMTPQLGHFCHGLILANSINFPSSSAFWLWYSSQLFLRCHARRLPALGARPAAVQALRLRHRPPLLVALVGQQRRAVSVRKDTLAFTAVNKFHPDQVYYHGCLKSFLQITKWKGPEVIYFGDHLFSDLRGPSKAGWRTAAIIHELEGKFHIIQELLGELYATVPSHERREAYYTLLNELDEEYHGARSIMRSMFNSSFGATFLTDTGQDSAFAYHIHQYADVYTSKPENFMLHSPDAWFHPPYDVKIMPHHVKVPSSLLKIKQE
ncbi:hypothetical protein Taro_024168 [Colocasia esculenta]|uniref:5'-nucleotidase domain-containing protein n=1 Tax=Colocasia esculenta TaxID=4460 RepID=A0A843V5P4_COLES|nr:hypothetical protein [Colocasia esculenta]